MMGDVGEARFAGLRERTVTLEELLSGTYFERKAGETPRHRADGIRCGVFPEPNDRDCADALQSHGLESDRCVFVSGCVLEHRRQTSLHSPPAEPGDVEEQSVLVDCSRTSLGVFSCGRIAYLDMDDRSAVVAACGPRDLSDTTLINIAIEAIESR